MKNKNYINNTADAGIPSKSTHAEFFEIHVKGHLDSSWADWLEGLEIKLLDNGEMVLSGHIEDQAALMGVLNKLYRLNLTLLSLNQVKPNNRC
jgi:hypothetical protein